MLFSEKFLKQKFNYGCSKDSGLQKYHGRGGTSNILEEITLKSAQK